MRGFWNDVDGLTIDEFAALLVLPLFLFVGVRMAIAEDISSTQVDFFTVLTYPILGVVARKAVERFGFPVIGRRNSSQVNQSSYDQESVPVQSYYGMDNMPASTSQQFKDDYNRPSI